MRPKDSVYMTVSYVMDILIARIRATRNMSVLVSKLFPSIFEVFLVLRTFISILYSHVLIYEKRESKVEENEAIYLFIESLQ